MISQSFSRRAFVAGATMVAVTIVAPHHSADAQRPTAVQLQRQEIAADDGHRVTLWLKRPSGTPRGAILLLHGRTWSSLPNFDLQVSGTRVSLMDAFVSRGYAVYALDQRGYGGTARDPSGWLTPQRAERDAALTLDWIAEQSVHAVAPMRSVLLGYSRGAMTSMLVAQRHPEKLSALVLYGFPVDFTRIVAPKEPRTPPRVPTSAAAAGEDFITPSSTAAGVKEAYVRAATKSDPVRVDWRNEDEFNSLRPSALRTPTLLINGERDPNVVGAALSRAFTRLGNVDRWWITLTNSDHVAHLQRTDAFVHAVVSFIER